MAKHSDTSWKQDHPSTLFSNSVQRATHSVKQAMSHPNEQTVEQACQSIDHAQQALFQAEQYEEHLDIVEQNKEQLERIKQNLEETKDILQNL